MSDSIAQKRLNIVNMAKEIGITQTAAIHGINRKTIYRWQQKLEKEGPKALQNRCGKGSNHPARISEQTMNKILQLSNAHPTKTAAQLHSELQLDCSLSLIYKILSKNRELSAKGAISGQQLKNSLSDFTFHLYFKKILINPASGKRLHLLILEETASKIKVIGFTDELSKQSALLFADCCFCLLQQNNQPLHKISLHINARLDTAQNGWSGFLTKKFGINLLKKEEFITTSSDHSADIAQLIADIQKTYQQADKSGEFNTLRFLSGTFCTLLLHNHKLYEQTTKDSALCRLATICQTQPPLFFNKLLPCFSQIKPAVEDEQIWQNERLAGEFHKITDRAINLLCYLIDQPRIDLNLMQLLHSLKDNCYYSAHKASILYELGNYLVHTARHHEALKLLSSALELSSFSKNEELEMKIYGSLGEISHFESQNTAAERYFEKCRQLAEKSGNPRYVTVAMNNLAQLYESLGKFNKAIAIYTKIFNSVHDDADYDLKIYLLNNIGSCYLGVKKVASALRYFNLSLDTNAGRMPDSVIITNIALCYFYQGDFDRTIAMLKEEIDDLLQGNARLTTRYLSVLNSLIMVRVSIGDFADIFTQFQDCETVALEIKDEQALTELYLAMARFYLLSAKQEKALSLLEQAEVIQSRREDYRQLSETYHTRSLLLFLQKEYAAATVYHQKSLSAAAKINNYEYFESSLMGLRLELAECLVTKNLSGINHLISKYQLLLKKRCYPFQQVKVCVEFLLLLSQLKQQHFFQWPELSPLAGEKFSDIADRYAGKVKNLLPKAHFYHKKIFLELAKKHSF